MSTSYIMAHSALDHYCVQAVMK